MLIAKGAHIKAEEFKSAVVDGKKGCVSVSEITEQLSSAMEECLPSAHAVSGYDTVSAGFDF